MLTAHRKCRKVLVGLLQPDDLRMDSMSGPLTKQRMHDAIEQLPDTATVEDATERLCFLSKIDEGLRQSVAGETIPHQEAVRRLTA